MILLKSVDFMNFVAFKVCKSLWNNWFYHYIQNIQILLSEIKFWPAMQEQCVQTILPVVFDEQIHSLCCASFMCWENLGAFPLEGGTHCHH